MRVGVVGAGFMGRTHAEAWASIPDVEVAGITSGGDPSGAALAAELGTNVVDTTEELAERVDVLDICAPTHLHRRLVELGAEAGVHVICEKPLALTPEDADAAVAACERAGVRLLVGHVVRFFPEYRAVRAQLMAGELGEPAVLRLRRLTYQPKKAADNWFVDEAKSGGLVFDLLIHDLDVARWLAGDVESVHARSVRGSDPAAPFDHVTALLRHRGGALSHVEASWAQPVGEFRTSFDIAGDLGFSRFDSDEAAPVRARVRDTGDVSDVPAAATSPLAESPYRTQLSHFRDVLLRDAVPDVTAADGAAAVRLATAVARSVRTGEVVVLDGPPREETR